MSNKHTPLHRALGYGEEQVFVIHTPMSPNVRREPVGFLQCETGPPLHFRIKRDTDGTVYLDAGGARVWSSDGKSIKLPEERKPAELPKLTPIVVDGKVESMIIQLNIGHIEFGRETTIDGLGRVVVYEGHGGQAMAIQFLDPIE